MYRNLIEKYQTTKSGYLNRSHRGKWLFVRNAGNNVFRLLGASVLDPNFKVYWYSFVPCVLLFDIFISYVYTLWYYSDEPLKGILFIPILGILIPVVLVYIVTMISSSKEKLQSLAFFAGEKIYTDIDRDSDHNYIRVCDESAIKLFTSTMKTLGIIGISMIASAIFPMMTFLQQHEIQLPIPVLLPFTNPDTSNGLAINILNQVFFLSFGMIANIGIEIMTCMLKNSVWAITVAICHSIDELTNLVNTNAVEVTECESESLEESVLESNIRCHFRNILIQVQDYDCFTLGLSDIYYWKFFLQPILHTFSVSMFIFFGLTGIWSSGFGYALGSYAQMYILCDIGNEVDSAKDKVLLKFNDMPWYLLSRKNQLDYIRVLHSLQNGAILQIGPFFELNFETFSVMSKRIYSFLMTLLTLMK